MKRWIYILVPVAALGALIVWRLQKKEQEAFAQSEQRAARAKAPVVVTVAPVVQRDIVETFEASGTIEAPFNVNLSANIPAQIVQLDVREGDRVTAGQVVIRQDASDFEGDINRQKALVAEAQSRLAQAMINQSPTIVSVTSQIREREAELATAEAELDQVKENSAARKATMRAAIDDAQGRINDADAAIATAEASVRSAQANLNNAKTKLARVQDLHNQGFIAAQDVDDAKTTVSVQEQEVEVVRGRVAAAQATRASMVAQKVAAERAYDIGVVTTGTNQRAAEAKVRQARAALSTARANTAQKPAYEQNIAALRAAVDAAKSAVRTAESRRGDTIIRAPLSGTVTARHMDPGTLATPGQPILTIQTASQVWVTFPAPEAASGKIRVGMPVRVKLDAFPGRTFAARVVQVNPSADPASRQFQIRAGLDNRAGQLKPGMFARIAIETDRIPDALVAPREAVQDGKQGAEVVVVNEENVAHRHTVAIGASDAKGIAVRGEIEAGDKVVTLSGSPVKDGQKVKIDSGEKLGGGGKPAVSSPGNALRQ